MKSADDFCRNLGNIGALDQTHRKGRLARSLPGLAGFRVIPLREIDQRGKVVSSGAIDSDGVAPGNIAGIDARSRIGPRLAVARALVEARRFAAIAAFELGMLPARAWPERGEGLSFDALGRLAGATFAVVGQEKPAPYFDKAVGIQDEALSAWLIASSEKLSRGLMVAVPLDPSMGLSLALEELPLNAPISLRATLEARVLLRSEIENVVSVRA